MTKMLTIFLAATLLAGCEKSPDSMCEDLFNESLKVASAAGAKDDDSRVKQFKEMKATWVGSCAKQSVDQIKAAHKMIK